MRAREPVLDTFEVFGHQPAQLGNFANEFSPHFSGQIIFVFGQVDADEKVEVGDQGLDRRGFLGALPADQNNAHVRLTTGHQHTTGH